MHSKKYNRKKNIERIRIILNFINLKTAFDIASRRVGRKTGKSEHQSVK